VIAKRIPGQFGDNPMVLVQIVPIVRKDEIGGKVALQVLKVFLNGRTEVGKKTLAEIFDDNLFRLSVLEEPGGAVAGFASPLLIGAEHNPTKLGVRVRLKQSQDRAAAADFNIVGVGAEAKDTRGRVDELRKAEVKH